ncbi:efflux RND transporter permease subunit [Xanthovirga aplysinae]|uniref:efflux RND transporter permease subunit n=1 Tax=Xanthovirga aplysinae TaxID=2529853 RepID=UPI0012BD7690|nr:efflux RND transporter permease subunit [Xanthovirga aplysinae]MTI33235.1 efflux RND transporter permease subunit [Xanthovirga aplysinae]
MSLSSISINRPVLAIVMSLTIILFGIVAFQFLGIREYPSIDPPVISVSTAYTGANANIIESEITEPLEEAINGIAGINTLSSVSRDGRSTIIVIFDLDTDLEAAANDVRDRVSGVINALPSDAGTPVIRKADANAWPIIFLSVRSNERDLLSLTDFANRQLKERFQTIPGVSSVQVWGAKKYSMRLWMDPQRMAAYKLTPADVYKAVNRANIELPSGRIEGKTTELIVKLQGRLNTPEQFNALIVKENGSEQVRFRDIGYAELAPVNQRTILKKEGYPLVGVVIVVQPGSNSIAIADEFYKRMKEVRHDMPKDIELSIGFDNTIYIKQSIKEVLQTIFIAFSLVVMIIFLFLRDWRTTVIPIATIPISLIGTFFIMFISGFSINVLTLLGIVLAIGLVVDDTIVVLENIYKKIEAGMPAPQAGFKGSGEIFFAVVSTTAALVAVFLPVIFLQGFIGRLFREFGIIVAGAVIISSFVALSLTPMLCTRILKRTEQHNWLYRRTEPFFNGLNNAYNRSLEAFMRYRWTAFIFIFLSVGMIYTLGKQLSAELTPLEDRNNFRIFALAPEGSTFEYMDNYVDQLLRLVQEKVIEADALISLTSPGFGATSSVNSAFMFIKLMDSKKRKRSQNEIVEDLSPALQRNTLARAFVVQPQSLGGTGGGISSLPVEFVIQASTLDQLKEVTPVFMQKARQDTTFSFVDLNLKFNKPQFDIEIDREKAHTLGLSVMDVAQTLQLAISGQRFSYFIMNGKQYPVIGQVSREDRDDPLDLQSIYMSSKSGKLIQMDNLVQIKERSTPPQLFRYNRYVSATISANLSKNKTLGDGIDAMKNIADDVLDERFSTALSGYSKDYEESSSSLWFAFFFALLLIYLVLSAQFESFIDPIIIMFTVPLALAGAILALWYFGETLNIFSEIGIIMLIGLVTKNGILIVEFANQLKQKGMSKNEAIVGAAELRFRPVLMTSLSTVLGILPIALALGAGSESRVSMGIAVIGGLVFSTLLTLYLIPALYSYLSGKKAKIEIMKREE